MDDPVSAADRSRNATDSQLPLTDKIEERSFVVSAEDEAMNDSELVAAVLQRIANENNAGAVVYDVEWIANGDIENATISATQSSTHLICEQQAEAKNDSGFITLLPVPADELEQRTSFGNCWTSQTYDVNLHDGLAYLQPSGECREDGTSGGISTVASAGGMLSLLAFSPGTIDLSGNSEPFVEGDRRHNSCIPAISDDASNEMTNSDLDESQMRCGGESERTENGAPREKKKGHPIDKTQHNAVEKWRRTRMKNSCALLRELVPGVGRTTEKATVFELTAQYLIRMKPFVNEADQALEISPTHFTDPRFLPAEDLSFV